MQVKQRIMEDFANVPPHTRLPSRPELAKRYHTTRTTVDRAISELIGSDFLYARDGSGTYRADGMVLHTSSRDVMNWAVIVPNIMHDTYPGIVRGVEDVAREHNANVTICNTDNRVEEQTKYIYKLSESGVDGIVVVPAIIGKPNLEPFQYLADNRIPFVCCNRGIEGVASPRVISNNFHGSYLATKHLIQQGYRRIAYISRPRYSVSMERYQGYLSALSEHELHANPGFTVFEESFELDRPGYWSMRELLQLEEPPDAVVCFNDLIAVGVYQAMTEQGLRVGEDVGIIGYDDSHVCNALPVRLSSVRFKTYEVGKQSANLLLSILNGEQVEKDATFVVQPEVVLRESSLKSISLNV